MSEVIEVLTSSTVVEVRLPGQQAPFSPAEITYTVGGGTLGTQPTFSGDPLFYGSYILVGDMISFRVNVDFDNVTSFGTGQYYITLPFDSAHEATFRDGCLHRASNGREYQMSGHVAASSNQLQLHYTGNQGYDEAFDSTHPYTLTVNDFFHIKGTYFREAN